MEKHAGSNSVANKAITADSRGIKPTLLALISGYLFVSLFKACAESLATKNNSRLSAMQRSEKNIEELLEDLRKEYQRLRQSSIDEELFAVITGFKALKNGTENKPQKSTAYNRALSQYYYLIFLNTICSLCFLIIKEKKSRSEG